MVEEYSGIYQARNCSMDDAHLPQKQGENICFPIEYSKMPPYQPGFPYIVLTNFPVYFTRNQAKMLTISQIKL